MMGIRKYRAIGDVGTFARTVVTGFDGINDQKPLMTIETSREYIERVEAETILKILKSIIDRYGT